MVTTILLSDAKVLPSDPDQPRKWLDRLAHYMLNYACAFLKGVKYGVFSQGVSERGDEAFDGKENDQARQLQSTLWSALRRPRPEYALFSRQVK
jgi:hypothetical protein